MKINNIINDTIPPRFRFYIHLFEEKTFGLLKAKRRASIFEDQERAGLDNIPIFIISYNRLSYLQSLLKRLKELGKERIIIIDNASSYPPLLEYYKTLPYEIVYLKENRGHKVFWENPIFEKYRNSFYIITDPDIEPLIDCPQDFVENFFSY
jgi:Glycosyl transferase family 2.